MKEFDITDPLPRGTTVLEASAGTGKTWTIAALATRLIAEGELGITDLLIVTFTRAATKELRSRVRDRLQQVAGDLDLIRSGAPPGEEHDPLVRFLATGAGPRSTPAPAVLGEAELGARIGRLREAAWDIDAATISTIHEFCHDVLRGIGVAGEGGGGHTLVDSAADLLAEVVDDLYLHMFSSSDAPPFDHATARRIATAVTNNPSAEIRPAEAPPGEGPPGEGPGEGSAPAAQRSAFAHAVRAEFQRRKRDRGVLTFDDVLTGLADSLDPPASDPARGRNAELARDRVRERWKTVLVDEFQDTDDTQWRILKAAFHGERDLILIGDPKQAIYSFRGGDINTYLEAVRTAPHAYTLGHNYRADEPLVEATGGILRDAELGHEQIRVRPIAAGKRRTEVKLPTDAGGRIRIRVVDIENFTLSRTKFPRIGELREAIAGDVAIDIAELLAQPPQVRDSATDSWRDAEPSDIAVLCHTNRDARQVQQKLADLGIHGVVSGGSSVFTSEAAAQWLTLLDAMDQRGNTGLARAAALGPFFAYTGADLAEDPDAVLDDVTARLREFDHLLTTSGCAAVFEAAQGGREASMAARVLGHVGGERLLTDLRHLSELMQAAPPRTGASTLALWLRGEQQAVASDAHLRRLESDAAAVQLMTIHAAKGLQFPFVYLPTVGVAEPKIDAIPVFNLEGRRVVDVGGKPAGEHAARVRAEARGEQLRLFYVALTRAAGQVTMYWAPARGAGATAMNTLLTRGGEPLPANTPAATVCAELRTRLGEHARIELVTAREARPLTQALPELSGGARAWTRTLDSAWRRSSYTSLSAGAETLASRLETERVVGEPDLALTDDEEDLTEAAGTAAPRGDAGDLPSPMANLPKGAQFGSLVHGVLETVNTRAEDLSEEIRQRIDEQLRHWPQDLDPEELRAAIEAVLRTPLAPALPATLSELDPTEQLAELEFELPLDGGHRAAPSDALVSLRDLAPILRRHLRPADPMFGYARVVDSRAYELQSLRGYLTGSIDLVFRHEGRFYVADYKTNWLGPTDIALTTADYDRAGVNAAMETSSYPLQALLYTVALHRYLRWRLPGYDPGEHIGGVLYLYVRGMAGPETPVIDGHAAGVYFWAPPPGLVTELSDLLDGAAQREGEG